MPTIIAPYELRRATSPLNLYSANRRTLVRNLPPHETVRVREVDLEQNLVVVHVEHSGQKYHLDLSTMKKRTEPAAEPSAWDLILSEDGS